ncbi:MAG: polyprenyl synthetase family protein [Phycisphaerales bacterium]
MQASPHAHFETAMATEVGRLPVEVRDVAGEFCSNGKRLRPLLVQAFALSHGATSDAWLAFGVALELLHKASLIQDDLPIMDDDEMRSGHPAVHATSSPAHALLASDAMIGHAFRLGAESAHPAEAVTLMSDALAALCGGQLKDLHLAGKNTTADWTQIADEKTGALFALAARLGVLAAGRLDDESHQNAQKFGVSLGRLYQLFDDIADGESSAPMAALNEHRDAILAHVQRTPQPAALRRYVEQLQKLTEKVLSGSDPAPPPSPPTG